MYNRYIGNTGKFYRVEDPEPEQGAPPRLGVPPFRELPPLPVWEPVPPPPPDVGRGVPPSSPPLSSKDEGAKFDMGAMFNMPGTLRETLRDKLPERLDLGDLLLVIVLIYLFLEGDDDDMLIILGVLLFTWIWPLFKKDDEA